MMKMLAPAVGYVYYLAMARAERRHGVGGVLLDRCLTSLSSLGASTILACVTDGNIPSERLVISRGFLPCGLGSLVRQFGAIKALEFWIGMTVAPGEKLFAKIAQSAL
jgi:L-amino acid N-acyltransferase YncA